MSEENREEQELMSLGPDAVLLRDRHFWYRREDGVVVPTRTSPHEWQAAIEAAEGPTPKDAVTQSNLAPLIELLESDVPMSSWDRRMLADLLRRHNPLTKPGRKKPTPLYQLPEGEQRFIQSMAHYRMLREAGVEVEKATRLVAATYGLTFEALSEAVRTGRRSATRTGRQTGARAKKKP